MNSITQIAQTIIATAITGGVAILWSLNSNVIDIKANMATVVERQKSQEQTVANLESRVRSLEIKRP